MLKSKLTDKGLGKGPENEKASKDKTDVSSIHASGLNQKASLHEYHTDSPITEAFSQKDSSHPRNSLTLHALPDPAAPSENADWVIILTQWAASFKGRDAEILRKAIDRYTQVATAKFSSETQDKNIVQVKIASEIFKMVEHCKQDAIESARQITLAEQALSIPHAKTETQRIRGSLKLAADNVKPPEEGSASGGGDTKPIDSARGGASSTISSRR